MATNFDVQNQNGLPVLLVSGSLDINSAPKLAEAIDQLLGTKPAKVVVDLSGLDLIDSSGVAALVKLYKGIRGQGGNLEMKGTRDQPLAIFKLLRMDKVFGIA